jgi:hypothetical protein
MPRKGENVEGPDTLAGARPVCESGNVAGVERGSMFNRDISGVHVVPRPVY